MQEAFDIASGDHVKLMASDLETDPTLIPAFVETMKTDRWDIVAGSRWIKELGVEAAQGRVMEELDRTFRPEFLNRIDEIILFRSLTKDDLLRIVDIQVCHLRELLEERQIGLELTGAARQHIAEPGYDPGYGARPLKRVIQREVQDLLALALLRGEFAEGDVVRVDARDGRVVFEKV